MSGKAVAVFPGSRLIYCGDAVEVVDFDHRGVTIKNLRTGEFTSLSVGRLAADAQAAGGCLPESAESAGVLLASLTADQRDEVQGRAGHVRELLTGYRTSFAVLRTSGRGCSESCGCDAERRGAVPAEPDPAS